MKSGIAITAVFYITCPHCAQEQYNADGGMNFTGEDLKSNAMTCQHCSKRFGTPKIAKIA